MNKPISFFIIYLMVMLLPCTAQTQGNSDCISFPQAKVQIFFQSQAGSLGKEIPEGQNIKIKKGETIDFISKVHGSVGITFDIKYDSLYFKSEYLKRYDNPDAIASGACGADRATVTYKLTALKKGKVKVTCIEGWQGSIAREVRYTIIIE